ncbi:hypothetical protein ES703_90001 [subsurface metagenome]
MAISVILPCNGVIWVRPGMWITSYVSKLDAVTAKLESARGAKAITSVRTANSTTMPKIFAPNPLLPTYVIISNSFSKLNVYFNTSPMVCQYLRKNY